MTPLAAAAAQAVMSQAAMDHATTAGGYLLVLSLMLPAIGLLAIVVLGGSRAERVALASVAAGLVVNVAIAVRVLRSSDGLTYALGGWKPPLGLVLRADGLSAALLVMAAWVIGATACYAHAQFKAAGARVQSEPAGEGEAGEGQAGEGQAARTPVLFWILLLAVWGGLNAVFLGEDLFNLYVALELLTFAAVPLVSLDGRAETLAAALRYLLFALAGSMLYLLGVGLLYGAYGTLDIRLLSRVIEAGPAASVAIGLMTAGLLAKAALFPLHLWLPPAHAGAPPAASAVLSALVIKAPFFLILRLWLDVAPQPMPVFAAHILGGLGAASILFCSVLALRQARLKLMIAYSTVAQLGYLFLVFPLAAGAGTEPGEGLAWSALPLTGATLQLISHALAKAAMFMAAGAVAEAFGHDRIAELGGFGRVLPVSAFAFVLGGLSLMGLPPSGGFLAKLFMLGSAVDGGHWWLALVILAGGLLAAGYVFRVAGQALGAAAAPAAVRAPVPRLCEAVALALALCAVALGFLPLQPFAFLAIGRPALAGIGAP